MKAIMGGILLCIVCFFTGCQATPEKSAVQYKDQGRLMEQVKQTASAEQKENTAKRMVGRVTNEKGDRVIVLDAEIHGDLTQAYPVWTISPKEITEADAQRYLQALIGDRTLYATDNGNVVLSKDWIEKRILYFQKAIAEAEDPADREALAYELEYIQGKYADAPESRYAVPASLIFSSDEQALRELEYEWETFGRLYGVETAQEEYEQAHKKIVESLKNSSPQATRFIEGIADMGEGYEACVRIWKNKSGKDSGVEFSRYSLQEHLGEAFGQKTEKMMSVAISRTDALETAQTMLKKLGIDYMIPAETKTDADDEATYHFVFVRAINGIAASVAESPALTDALYREIWEQERVDIWVDDRGICRLLWVSPSNLETSINEDVALLSTGMVQEICLQQMMNQLPVSDPTEDNFVIRREYRIDKACLGTMTIAREGTEKSYLVIPVWDFYGTCTLTYSPDYLDQPGHLQLDAQYQRQEKMTNISCLTINAVDGTVIDRTRGY